MRRRPLPIPPTPERPVTPIPHLALLALFFAARAVPAAQDPKTRMDYGHSRRAKTLIYAEAASRPDDARTLYLRAYWMLGTGDAQGALPIAEKAAAMMPRDADYRYQVAGCVGTM